MREILFHGKRADNGEWVEGDLLQTRYHSGHIEYQIMPQTPVSSAYPVLPETVGQFTGLTDRNGKRIFEGDILGSRYYYLYPDNVAVEVVKWICNGWAIQEGDRPPMLLEEDGILPYSEVIGNVHDNKELWGN